MEFCGFDAHGMLFVYALTKQLMANHMLTHGDSSWKRLSALSFSSEFSGTLLPEGLTFFRYKYYRNIKPSL